MSTVDDVPDEVPEEDYLEQQQLADGSDDGDAVPVIDPDAPADPADLQEQSTPVPIDEDEDDRR